MLISIGYRKVVATAVVLEVQGISHRSDWCVREDEEPTFKDGYALMTLNATINNNNNNFHLFLFIRENVCQILSPTVEWPDCPVWISSPDIDK